ncbi:putative Ig domain-containing protein, partial [Peptostreptococcus porci]|uniref:putative Ig domain-containing protein n=1 Tax=Peptostreptococcus porci TaxID=2652282 RepID=UPI002A91AD2D
MDNLKKFIEEKKKQPQSKPRYALRKLSVGVVSCMIGYFLFCSPVAVQAAEVSPETTSVVETTVNNDESKIENNKDLADESVSSTSDVTESNDVDAKEATLNTSATISNKDESNVVEVEKAPENIAVESNESNVSRSRARRSIPNAPTDIEVREADVSADANNAVHGIVGIQLVGDVNMDMENPANSKYYEAVNGVDVYFQWIEEATNNVSPVYKATSGADGKFHIGIEPYLTSSGKLIKFDADTTVSAGNERYRFWVDTATIPEKYQLAWITGEGVIFPNQGLPYTGGGASNSTAKNQLNGFKVLLKEKEEAIMHKDTPTQTLPKVDGATSGGSVEGIVAWDWNSGIGGVQYSTIQDSTIPAKDVKVVASYLSDYAMKQIFTPNTARDLGVGSENDIRGAGWTPAQEEALQNWIKNKIKQEGKELWIAETVEATTNADGKYIIQFNGTWGAKSNREAATYTREANKYNFLDAHKWTEEEVNRLGKVSDNPQNGSFAAGALDWTEKHINYDFVFVSLKNTDDLSVLTPYNHNQFTAHNDAWGIHNGWGTGTFKSVVYPLNKSLNESFSLRSAAVKFEIVDYNSTTNLASPGTKVDTNTTGLPYKNSADTQYRIAWYDEDGKEITPKNSIEKAKADGTISSNPHTSDLNLVEGKTYTAKLIQVNPNGKDGNVIAVDSYTVVPNSPVGSVMEDYNWHAMDESENVTYTAKGLPEGLSYKNGIVSGKPDVGQDGVYDVVFEAKAADQAGEVKSTIHRTLIITDAPLATGKVGSEYNQEVKLSGLPDDGNYKYEIKKVELDPKLKGLNTSKEGEIFKITGTPESKNTANEEQTNVKITSNIYKLVGSEWRLISENHIDNVPLLVVKEPGVEITNADQTVLDETPIQDIIITPEDPEAIITVGEDKLPDGVFYDPKNGIVGTPDVTDWNGKDDEEREFTVPVKVENEDGSTVDKTVTITVQRDTDNDGTADVEDTDDDGDGVPDQEEIEKGTDPKDPNSKPETPAVTTPGVEITNGDQKVLDETPIKDVVIRPEDPKATVTVEKDKLPGGVTYDEPTKTISGTPDVTDWNGKDDEEREFTVPVKVENEDGSTVDKTVTITVQRDTDNDGTADVEDTDDDGDGVPDQEEIEKGTDPKDPNSKPE